MADNARRTGPALEAHQQFLLWLVPTVEKFPRTLKFTLGDRIQAVALDVLEALIEATYTRDRRAHLARANLGYGATIRMGTASITMRTSAVGCEDDCR